MKGLETTVAPLLEALNRDPQHPGVQLAVARALIELDARESAPSLFRLSQTDEEELRHLIEPALARWDYRPVREVWLERLRHADFSDHGLPLALRGLLAVREERATSDLHDLVLNGDAPPPLRLEAARALAELRAAGSESDASQLMADRSPRGIAARLAAATLLRHHQGTRATGLLQELAVDRDPAVAAVALTRLVEIDSHSIVPALPQILNSYDPQARELGVEVLFRIPSEHHIHLLVQRLSDADAQVRRKARKSLQDLAVNKDFRILIVPLGEKVLAGSDWRGLEQAAILLAQLQDKSASRRLVELLRFQRAEVFVTGAWALKELRAAEALPAALEHFRLMTGQADPVDAVDVDGTSVVKSAPAVMVDQQLSQLAQLFGITRYSPADKTLRKLIPRPMNTPNWPEKVGTEARAASIWALGKIHEGKEVAEIADSLEGRLKDVWAPLHPPEDERVRSMSAVTLGRMVAKNKLDTLRRFYPARRPSLDSVNNACGWAIEQMAHEVMPPSGTVQVPGMQFKNWLSPLDSETKE
jgi:HEAT repeat protein